MTGELSLPSFAGAHAGTQRSAPHCSMDALSELTQLPAKRYGSADDVVRQVMTGARSRSS
jgi:hypothetical protein